MPETATNGHISAKVQTPTAFNVVRNNPDANPDQDYYQG
jgi:hypothetical protein